MAVIDVGSDLFAVGNESLRRLDPGNIVFRLFSGRPGYPSVSYGNTTFLNRL